MDLQRIKMQKTCNLISSEVKDFQTLSKVFSKWCMSLLDKRNIFKRIFVGLSALCSVLRSSSSWLETQHDSLIVATSFEEFNGESSGGKVICMDYIAWIQPFLIPLKGTVSNWLGTDFAQSPMKTWNEEQSLSQHAVDGTGQGLLITGKTLFDTGWTEEEVFREENRWPVPWGTTQHQTSPFTHISVVFQWWEELVPSKNLLRNRQLTLFFKIEFKIKGLFLPYPYSSLLNNIESQYLWSWHGNCHTNFLPKFYGM